MVVYGAAWRLCLCNALKQHAHSCLNCRSASYIIPSRNAKRFQSAYQAKGTVSTETDKPCWACRCTRRYSRAYIAIIQVAFFNATDSHLETTRTFPLFYFSRHACNTTPGGFCFRQAKSRPQRRLFTAKTINWRTPIVACHLSLCKVAKT